MGERGKTCEELYDFLAFDMNFDHQGAHYSS